MEKILLNGISINELLDKIGQLIENKIGQNNNQPQKQDQSKFISRKEVAKLLKISLPTLNDWTKSGLLNSYRIGTRVLYKPDEVEQSLTQRNFTKFRKGGNHGA
ncbi:MAG: helix-turn-helix domain-containing protein [Bacteroidota bacterium]|nr:helix-turn-helix domain-containing protein [Bacteroidota bacterium]